MLLLIIVRLFLSCLGGSALFNCWHRYAFHFLSCLGGSARTLKNGAP
ncbi:hypothetical protein KUC_0960 [Vreelandella boliviensis LC1]|uniref:Uncharacterized protein n=1 Tax=Vreelandella boliviensis LC1 TaxID=1072583 RepID=A0A7U9C2J6_9GAMM|nr:hypothetical protein KUC_0960 [Halomonas boliviensis LC1]